MCLIAIALDQHARFPLVIAANRDEFLQRPTAPLAWWLPAPGAAAILGGRDLQAGGTWMGLATNGRVALLTNVRDPTRHNPRAPSRGAIVPAWLQARQPATEFWRDMRAREHNPFNLLAADLVQDRWWWAGDGCAEPRGLGGGLYGLSNAALDTPWPKVQRLKRALADALGSAASCADIESHLFAALTDRTPVADESLPRTGVGLERERWLAPAFIRTPDSSYGTRCSTILIAERRGDGVDICYTERQFDPAGSPVSQRRVRLADGPMARVALPQVELESFSAT